MPEPGVTQELRSRAGAHIAAESRWRRIVVAMVLFAIIAACAYFVLRWLA